MTRNIIVLQVSLHARSRSPLAELPWQLSYYYPIKPKKPLTTVNDYKLAKQPIKLPTHVLVYR